MLVFNNYFCKNRKSKLHFGDRVAILSVLFTKPEGEKLSEFDNVLFFLKKIVEENKKRSASARKGIKKSKTLKATGRWMPK
jgi:hypothetical protein